MASPLNDTSIVLKVPSALYALFDYGLTVYHPYSTHIYLYSIYRTEHRMCVLSFMPISRCGVSHAACDKAKYVTYYNYFLPYVKKPLAKNLYGVYQTSKLQIGSKVPLGKVINTMTILYHKY